MAQTKWKLLKPVSKYPAGAQLIRDAAGVWYEQKADGNDAFQPVERNIAKMLDGLIAAPKNWIELMEGVL